MIITASDVGRWAVYFDGAAWQARAILSIAATRVTVGKDPTVTTDWTKVVMVAPMPAALALVDKLTRLQAEQAAETEALDLRHGEELRRVISAAGGEA